MGVQGIDHETTRLMTSLSQLSLEVTDVTRELAVLKAAVVKLTRDLLEFNNKN